MARKRLLGLENVDSVQTAAVMALPFDDDRFDTVVSFLMLHHVVDWQKGLTEIARVLKPGGGVIGYDLTDTRFARMIHRADRSPHRMISPDQLDDGLASAGFTSITLRPSNLSTAAEN